MKHVEILFNVCLPNDLAVTTEFDRLIVSYFIHIRAEPSRAEWLEERTNERSGERQAGKLAGRVTDLFHVPLLFKSAKLATSQTHSLACVDGKARVKVK